LLAATGRLDEALDEFRDALRLNAGDQDTHLCLATALARTGQYALAEISYRNLLRLQPEHIVGRLGLAETLCNLDRPGEAERVLREAPVVREPMLAAALAYGLGIATKQQKKYSQALALFETAQSHQPDYPAMDFVCGQTLQQMGQWELAAQSFRKVLTRQPGHANAAGSLALILALTGNFAEARKWAAKTLILMPAHGIAHIAAALAEIENGEFIAASARLQKVLTGPEASLSEGTAVAAEFAADAFDRHGHYQDSFAVTHASKAMLRPLWAARTGDKRITSIAEELTNYLDDSLPWKPATVSATDAQKPAGHIFVLGFLRSGTTLIETILATNPNVVLAEEIDFLADPARALAMDQKGLGRLAALPAAEVATCRHNYWRAVRDSHLSVGGKILVDKMPINTLRLPLIARLFPEARIVFAIRDPRDVVLSCFRRHFDPTPYSLEFLQLDDCAHFYAATMAFAEACLRKIPFRLLELRYEDIVDNFDDTTRTLL
jgi:tetratricopeptide (TPR) repeat protein